MSSLDTHVVYGFYTVYWSLSVYFPWNFELCLSVSNSSFEIPCVNHTHSPKIEGDQPNSIPCQPLLHRKSKRGSAWVTVLIRCASVKEFQDTYKIAEL